jgi:putative serine protease PepD
VSDETPAAPTRSQSPNSGLSRNPVLVLVLGLILGLAGGFVGGYIGGRTAVSNGSSSGAAGTCDVTRVASSVLPSIVTLKVSSGSAGGSGTGVIIQSDGTTITNDHVIAPAGDNGTVQAVLDDGTEHDAEILGRDPRTDLAVVKIKGMSNAPALQWGNANALTVGTPVVAAGAPLGLSGTITSGVVSALGRNVPVPTESGSTILVGAIQTDASINPGNSGGALVTCDNRLVGINTAIATQGENGASGSIGIGFAVPSTVAEPIFDQLLKNGSVNHPSFGMETTAMVAQDASGSTHVGLRVDTVTSGGPAAAAGLQAGDIITGVKGQGQLHPDTFAHLAVTSKAGDQFDVEYLRDGQQHTATVTLR